MSMFSIGVNAEKIDLLRDFTASKKGGLHYFRGSGKIDPPFSPRVYVKSTWEGARV